MVPAADEVVLLDVVVVVDVVACRTGWLGVALRVDVVERGTVCDWWVVDASVAVPGAAIANPAVTAALAPRAAYAYIRARPRIRASGCFSAMSSTVPPRPIGAPQRNVKCT